MITHLLKVSVFCTSQPSCAERGPGGPGVSRGQIIGNAVAIAVATPKPGQTTRPDGGARDGDVTTCEDGASLGDTQTRDVAIKTAHNTINPALNTWGSLSHVRTSVLSHIYVDVLVLCVNIEALCVFGHG